MHPIKPQVTRDDHLNGLLKTVVAAHHRLAQFAQLSGGVILIRAPQNRVHAMVLI
jgi:hypothetical protein